MTNLYAEPLCRCWKGKGGFLWKTWKTGLMLLWCCVGGGYMFVNTARVNNFSRTSSGAMLLRPWPDCSWPEVLGCCAPCLRGPLVDSPPKCVHPCHYAPCTFDPMDEYISVAANPLRGCGIPVWQNSVRQNLPCLFRDISARCKEVWKKVWKT